MKKIKVLSSVLLLTTLLFTACVVEPVHPARAQARVSYVAPGIRVSYVLRGGVRYYRVPRGIRAGDIVIINGNRCTVRKVKRHRIKVLYPNGQRVWLHIEFR